MSLCLLSASGSAIKLGFDLSILRLNGRVDVHTSDSLTNKSRPIITKEIEEMTKMKEGIEGLKE